MAGRTFAENTSPTGKKEWFEPITIILFITCIILAGSSGYIYSKYKKSRTEFSQSQDELARLSDPIYISQLQQDAVTTTIEKLRRHILLPTDEEPTVATIIDVEALREENPEFYKDAQNDDQLIIFTKKAILYRDGEDIIINVAPVFLEPEGALESEETEDTSQ